MTVSACRVLADGLIAKAEQLPRLSLTARHLREAATSLLDADQTAEAEGLKIMFTSPPETV